MILNSFLVNCSFCYVKAEGVLPDPTRSPRWPVRTSRQVLVGLLMLRRISSSSDCVYSKEKFIEYYTWYKESVSMVYLCGSSLVTD